MRSHTVILGAGATIAAIPNGDKNGKSSSVMNGLIDKLHMSDVLSGVKLKTKSKNLEDIYSELCSKEEYSQVLKELENRIYDYFSSLELPEEPTVYDYLVLSLTRNDAIATFNWDPLLIQAYVRCHNITENLPHLYCLHGNVAVGYCEHDREYGTLDSICPECGIRFTPTKLLYPIKNKDYNNDPFIRHCWEATEFSIENSFMLTIFGYSAPNSDTNAVSLLKKAWGDLDNRELEEVSVIDIIDEEDMYYKWSDFIYTHHYNYTNNFFDSYLGKFPRRTCETIFGTFLMNLFADDTKGFHDGMSWVEIEELLKDLIEEENTTPVGKNYKLYYNSSGNDYIE